MREAKRTKLRKALKTLDLTPEATREEIIARKKALGAGRESSGGPDGEGGNAVMRNACDYLLKHHRSLKTLADEVSQTEGDGPSTSFFEAYEPYEIKTRTLEQEKRQSRIKRLAILSVLLMVALSISTGISIHRENTYDELRGLMLEFRYYHRDAIEDNIDALPKGYRDVDTIESRFQTIMEDVNTIETNDMITDHERMRDAYHTLVTTDETFDRWDLSAYLDAVDRRLLLIDIVWKNGDLVFQFIPDETNASILLMTNLPNDKDNQADYYYYGKDNYNIIGYKNKSDVIDRFDAYEILHIDEDELIILSHVNDEEYTLTPE